MLKIAAVIGPVMKSLEKAEKQIAYGTSVALNKAAFSARTAAQYHLEKRLILRNKFLKNSVIYKRASKTKLEAWVGVLERASWAERLEKGGTRRPKSSKNIVIPQGVRSDPKKLIPKRLRPSQLLARKDVFYSDQISPGIKGIWQRLPNNRLKLLYDLEPTTSYDNNQIELKKTMSIAALKSLERNLDKCVADAFRSAK